MTIRQRLLIGLTMALPIAAMLPLFALLPAWIAATVSVTVLTPLTLALVQYWEWQAQRWQEAAAQERVWQRLMAERARKPGYSALQTMYAREQSKRSSAVSSTMPDLLPSEWPLVSLGDLERQADSTDCTQSGPEATDCSRSKHPTTPHGFLDSGKAALRDGRKSSST